MSNHRHQPNFSNVHKHQLFHWLGADIDADLRARKLSAQDARAKYLTYLKDDLQHGLPIKCPRIPETLACNGVTIPLTQPIACFTEWALSESRPHSSRYGRMAFGFSKPWLIKHGGQPVTYFSYTRKGLFLQALVSLHELLRHQGAATPGQVPSRELTKALSQAFYLLHFAKPFAPPAAKRKAKPKPAAPPLKAVTLRPVLPPRPAIRRFGPVLEFLEEREWRIVRHDKPYFIPDPAGRFDSRLEFSLGTELFTLLVPDNELVKMLWRDTFLRARLLEAPVPVTVLSFTDLGTF